MFSKIYGTKGGASFRPLEIYTGRRMAFDRYRTSSCARGYVAACIRARTAHFAHCVLSGERPMPSMNDGVTVQRMLNAIYESAEQGKEISL